MRTLACLGLLMATACGGGDAEPEDFDSQADASCEGMVAGAISGAFADCRATANYYPAGSDQVSERMNSLLTVVASEVFATLPEGVESLGINLEVAGAPATGSFDWDPSIEGGGQDGFVRASDGTFYGEVVDASFEITSLESLGTTEDPDGTLVESFLITGSMDMTVRADDGSSATATATFSF